MREIPAKIAIDVSMVWSPSKWAPLKDPCRTFGLLMQKKIYNLCFEWFHYSEAHRQLKHGTQCHSDLPIHLTKNGPFSRAKQTGIILGKVLACQNPKPEVSNTGPWRFFETVALWTLPTRISVGDTNRGGGRVFAGAAAIGTAGVNTFGWRFYGTKKIRKNTVSLLEWGLQWSSKNAPEHLVGMNIYASRCSTSVNYHGFFKIYSKYWNDISPHQTWYFFFMVSN